MTPDDLPEIRTRWSEVSGGIDAAHRHNQRRLDDAVAEIRGERRLQPDFSAVPIVALKFEF